jgi:hypothetical protein
MAQSKAEKRRKAFMGHAMDMEVPLREATELVLALRLIGHGITAHDGEEGAAITTVAWQASERLAAVKELWDKAFAAAKRG